MLDDCDNWESSREDNNEWPHSFDSPPPGPSATIADLRDNALYMFNRYLAFRLKRKDVELTEAELEECRNFLSLDEAESILKEFNSQEGLPDGVYCIAAKNVEDLMRRTVELQQALMSRIMSNVLSRGVNMGLIDCSFEENDFTFSPSDAGEELIDKLRRKKKKNADPDD